MQMLPHGNEEDLYQIEQQFLTNPIKQRYLIQRAQKLGYKPKAQFPKIIQKNYETLAKQRNYSVVQNGNDRESGRFMK